MEHRKLGRSNLQVSTVSMGTEYLIGAPHEHIVSVIRYAIEHDINYFDLFPANPLFRDAMGDAFAPFRRQVMFGAHLGAMVMNTQYDKSRDIATCRAWFDDFLKRYRTDYVDILFLHNIDAQDDFDQVMAPGGVNQLAQEYKRQGVARTIGYSGHSVHTSLQAVESGQIDVLLFPVNLASNGVVLPENDTAADIYDLLNACVRHNVGVIAMKPYAGGQLFRQDKPDQQPITPVQCLTYVLAQPAVACVVPGCKDIPQIDAALAYFKASEAERDYAEAMVVAQQHAAGECLYCNHCLPCPAEIDIARVMRLHDKNKLQPSDDIRQEYNSLNATADDCQRCGSCEERCPFGVTVMDCMEQISACLGH